MRLALQIFLVLVLTTLPALAKEPPRIATLTGIAGVHDGDNLTFGKVHIRLQGIVAPDIGAAWGAEATHNLLRLAAGKEVVCYLEGTTAGSKRPVAFCFVGDLELNRQQVRDGVALDCPPIPVGVTRPTRPRPRSTWRSIINRRAIVTSSGSPGDGLDLQLQ